MTGTKKEDTVRPMKQADPLAAANRLKTEAREAIRRALETNSVEAVAVKVGFTASAVMKWRDGSSPSYSTARRILSALGGKS